MVCSPVTPTEIHNSSSQNAVLCTNSQTLHNVNSLLKISINTLSYIITPLIRLKIRRNTKDTTYKYQHRNRKYLQYTLYSPITAIHTHMQLQYYRPIKEVSRPTVDSASITNSACCYFHSHAVLAAAKIKGGTKPNCTLSPCPLTSRRG